MGIEPTPSAWKAEVLPLNYTRICFFIHRINTLSADKILSHGGGGRI